MILCRITDVKRISLYTMLGDHIFWPVCDHCAPGYFTVIFEIDFCLIKYKVSSFKSREAFKRRVWPRLYSFENYILLSDPERTGNESPNIVQITKKLFRKHIKFSDFLEYIR